MNDKSCSKYFSGEPLCMKIYGERNLLLFENNIKRHITYNRRGIFV